MTDDSATTRAVVGDRVSDFTIETSTSWRIDTEGVVPELPHMPLRVRNSSTVTTGPVAEILVQRTSGTRRRGLRITLIGGDHEQERDWRPFITFGNGSGWRAPYRTSALPQQFKDLVTEQTGVTW